VRSLSTAPPPALRDAGETREIGPFGICQVILRFDISQRVFLFFLYPTLGFLVTCHLTRVSCQMTKSPSIHSSRQIVLFVLVVFSMGALRVDLFMLRTDKQRDLSEFNSTPSGGRISSPFDKAVQRAYDLVVDPSGLVAANNQTRIPKKFNVTAWDRRTTGGLTDRDRTLLSRIYGQAESVFEYGLGESTYIADHMGVQRYAGIDSDAAWVANARTNVSPHFRFYFADIGPTRAWGYPQDSKLPKSILGYQLAPLIVEPLPFDVYMVDGRWRFPCMLASFLHASSRGADPTKTTVLLHDCTDELLFKPVSGSGGQQSAKSPPIRKEYRWADHLLDMVDHSGALLCVYKRKPETTDAQLLELWEQHFDLVV
jgi:hypothetical protein